MSKLQVDIESLSPAEYKNNTLAAPVNYGFHQTIFGNCLIGIINGKVCHLVFPADNAQSLKELQDAWPRSGLIENLEQTSKIVDKLFNKNSTCKISLLLKGTPFQLKVWQALAAIPFGSKVSYEAVAQKLYGTKFVRAVANSIGRNNISILIPCHRVIKKSGELHKYRWGADVKQQLLEWESAKN